MKRFLLFAFTNHYPDGGMNDYAGSFDSLEEAINFFNYMDSNEIPKIYQYAIETENGHVYDVLKGRIVWEYKN